MLVPAWALSFASEVTVRLAAGAPAPAAPSGSRGAGLTRTVVSARQGRGPFPGASRGQDAGFLDAGLEACAFYSPPEAKAPEVGLLSVLANAAS